MILELVAASIQISRFLDLAYFGLLAALILIAGHFGWQLIRQAAFDCVSIYTSAITASNKDRQRAELEIWTLKGRAAIEDRRAMLQAGNAAMWKAGAYDVMVDEAVKQ